MNESLVLAVGSNSLGDELLEKARGLLPPEEEPRVAVEQVIEEYALHRAFTERCYLRIWRLIRDQGYAKLTIQKHVCTGCGTIIEGPPPEWCPGCDGHQEHFVCEVNRPIVSQDELLEYFELVAGIARSTAYSRIQAYRRLQEGLGWFEDAAFAFHLWAAHIPKRALSSLGRWSRDGQLQAINRPHRLPGVEKEKVADRLRGAGFNIQADGPDEALDEAMDAAIEFMAENEEIAEAVYDITDMAKGSLSAEMASLVVLRPDDATRHIREDLLGHGHVEGFLFRHQNETYFAISFFPRVDKDGIIYEQGRVDKINCLGHLPSWVEDWLCRQLNRQVAPEPPERFIGKVIRGEEP